MKTVKFYTFGCKVNQYETQEMRERFLAKGLVERDGHVPVDIYVINTCTVTHNADADSLGAIRRARHENPRAKIMVTGCLTALDTKKIKQVDPRVIVSKKGAAPVLATSKVHKGAVPEAQGGITYFKNHTRAFLKIQDGCNNFCSYCKVPYVRGRSRSKPIENVIQEAESLAKNGYKEIVLTGICLGAYGRDLSPRKNLINAIDAVEKIEGIVRIRLSSIEPTDITDALIDKIALSKKLCRHLHIPLQSGDDEILKAMNRPYGARGYLALVSKIRKKIPLISITTDVMVGFPGETENNFRNTLKVVRKIGPLKVHIFPYSPRATAVVLDSRTEVDVLRVKSRMKTLQKLSAQCAKRYTHKLSGKELPVLIERKIGPNRWEGFTDTYVKAVVVSKVTNIKNEIVLVKLSYLKRKE